MKKVLIIDCVPYTSWRIPGLAKHLPELGWQPILLTIPWPQRPDARLRVIETPYRDALGFWGKWLRLHPFSPDDEDIRGQIKKRLGIFSKSPLLDFILTRIGEVVNYPDGDKGWKPFALKAGDELLQRENIDILLSSSPPITSHLIARELKTKYKVPWVADFRDLWSQNHNYSYGPIRKRLDRRLELKTLSMADALVTLSQPWAEKLKALHRGKTVYTITPGFDPAQVNNPPAKLTAKFTITYTGRIYTRKHDPVKLFIALRDLVADRVIDQKDVEVRFYGIIASWVETQVKEYGLSNIVHLFGQVPQSVALQKQRESQLLYITKWRDPQDRGPYSSKIFEYLAARRPILAADGSVDVVTELLNETNAGIDAPSLEDIKKAIQRLYQEYKLSGEIVYNGIDSKINKYSHREMAGKFSEILGNLA